MPSHTEYHFKKRINRGNPELKQAAARNAKDYKNELTRKSKTAKNDSTKS